MNSPRPGDYIDIHTHDSRLVPGVFAVENIMAHENRDPTEISAPVFTAGIHPWYLDGKNSGALLAYIRRIASSSNLIAFGEAGFDKLRGPSLEIQLAVFSEQVKISGEFGKPLVIHCVKAWNELQEAHRDLKPEPPWLVHGFRGKKDLALQLIKRGMYISFWFDFVIRPESSGLLKSLPPERIFLETDGADTDIREIYAKVSADFGLSVDKLKEQISSNYRELFMKKRTL
ncbi:MAG: TatD family hydrolase [Bacteroidales bacterium]|nr:TatD family hydrolase [Bacteroidales bacterium]